MFNTLIVTPAQAPWLRLDETIFAQEGTPSARRKAILPTMCASHSAQAGVHVEARLGPPVDPRLRGHDEN